MITGALWAAGWAGGWLGRPQPQRRLRRLHRLVDHPQQLGRQAVQVDLLVQPITERGDRLGGVVATAVEATVHRLLDAAAGRLEQGGHGQGGGQGSGVL
jgi:hypothetical protein